MAMIDDDDDDDEDDDDDNNNNNSNNNNNFILTTINMGIINFYFYNIDDEDYDDGIGLNDFVCVDDYY